MTKSSFAFAAALALPLAAPSVAQAPARIELESVRPTSGSWSYRALQGGSSATFLAAGGVQNLVVRCNRPARTVSVVRSGVPAAAATMSIWTTSTSRSVPARYDLTKQLTADLAASDPLLDAIAYSRGRFATAATGAPMLTVPASPEAARVIEDCRS
jgi:hypothetical protein